MLESRIRTQPPSRLYRRYGKPFITRPRPDHSMETHDLVGSLAGTLTTVSFIPQVIKTWRSRSASDISFGMFLLFSLGVLLWLFYGVSIHSTPIVLANGVTLVLSMSIIWMKFWFERHPR